MPNNDTSINWDAAMDEADAANDPQAIHDRVHPIILGWLSKALEEKTIAKNVSTDVTTGAHCVALDLFLGSFSEEDRYRMSQDTQDKIVNDWRLMFALGYAFRNSELAGEVDLNGA